MKPVLILQLAELLGNAFRGVGAFAEKAHSVVYARLRRFWNIVVGKPFRQGLAVAAKDEGAPENPGHDADVKPMHAEARSDNH